MGDGDEELSEEQRTGWRRLRSRAGVHQGRPLSCFLATLGLVKRLLVAQRAMDEFHAMERYPEGVSDADKAKARELAEKMGAVTSYLDDATFVSSVSALCVAYRAYCEMASRRGWKCVETKSVLLHGSRRSADAAPCSATGSAVAQVESHTQRPGRRSPPNLAQL
jgi:hypothetical protein